MCLCNALAPVLDLLPMKRLIHHFESDERGHAGGDGDAALLGERHRLELMHGDDDADVLRHAGDVLIALDVQTQVHPCVRMRSGNVRVFVENNICHLGV